MPTFEYGYANIADLAVIERQNEDDDSKVKRRPEYDIILEGRQIPTTPRFWTSLCSRYSQYGMSMNLIRGGLFTPKEAFDRLAAATSKSRNRYCIATNNIGEQQLLAITDPAKPVAKYDDVMALFHDHDGSTPDYLWGKPKGTSEDHGVVTCTNQLPHLPQVFELSGDEYRPRLTFEVPIDGFGKPQIYLNLLRAACMNGTIAMSPTFKSELSLGKGEDNVIFCIQRALEGYNNEDGFIALRERLEHSQRSWASISESQSLYECLLRAGSQAYSDKGTGANTQIGKVDGNLADWGYENVAKAFVNLTGDLPFIYGITHIDALSRRKMERLPTRATVYELINFATEVATHYMPNPATARSLHRYVGELLGGGQEFDLELSRDDNPSFTDFMTNIDEWRRKKGVAKLPTESDN